MYRRLFHSVFLAVAMLAWAAVPGAAADTPACALGPLKLASFNIQFLGSSAKRDNEGLADLVGDQDIVLVQELIAPPFAGSFPPNPDGTADPFKTDPQAAAFFEAMRNRGFSWVMSEEDTGTGERIHLNSTATEWWVAFYKPQAATPATDLPGGFLASDRSNHPDYERVPFAFPFRNCPGTMDFVLVSVHLQPDDGPAPRQRRQHEIASISRWIDAQEGTQSATTSSSATRTSRTATSWLGRCRRGTSRLTPAASRPTPTSRAPSPTTTSFTAQQPQLLRSTKPSGSRWLAWSTR